jgi:hypothetical protein
VPRYGQQRRLTQANLGSQSWRLQFCSGMLTDESLEFF